MTGIILAAGKSRRTQTPTPKVLLPLQGRPVLEYVLDTCRQARLDRVVLIVGHQRELVEQAFRRPGVEFAVQHEQRGTADAVLSCAGMIADDEDAVILSGDVPLLTPATLESLVRCQQQEQAELTLLTAVVPDPHGYGRIIRDAAGRVVDIVEERDATEEQRKIREMNVGLYAFTWGRVLPVLKRIAPSPVSGELYLTQLVPLIARFGRIAAVTTDDPGEFMGINTLEELHRVEAELVRRAGTADAGVGTTGEHGCTPKESSPGHPDPISVHQRQSAVENPDSAIRNPQSAMESCVH